MSEDRSSRPEVFCKKGVLRNFTKFTGKHLCQSFFFNKVAGRSNFIKNFEKKGGVVKACVGGMQNGGIETFCFLKY